MPTYAYRNAAGDEMDIVLPMSEDRPGAILPDGDGWKPVTADEPGAFLRVFTFAGARKAPGVATEYHTKGPPVSRSLPRRKAKPGDGARVVERSGHKIVEHRDGTRTNLKGQRIIENRADRRRAEDQTGARFSRDA